MSASLGLVLIACAVLTLALLLMLYWLVSIPVDQAIAERDHMAPVSEPRPQLYSDDEF